MRLLQAAHSHTVEGPARAKHQSINAFSTNFYPLSPKPQCISPLTFPLLTLNVPMNILHTTIIHWLYTGFPYSRLVFPWSRNHSSPQKLDNSHHKTNLDLSTLLLINTKYIQVVLILKHWKAADVGFFLLTQILNDFSLDRISWLMHS